MKTAYKKTPRSLAFSITFFLDILVASRCVAIVNKRLWVFLLLTQKDCKLFHFLAVAIFCFQKHEVPAFVFRSLDSWRIVDFELQQQISKHRIQKKTKQKYQLLIGSFELHSEFHFQWFLEFRCRCLNIFWQSIWIKSNYGIDMCLRNKVWVIQIYLVTQFWRAVIWILIIMIATLIGMRIRIRRFFLFIRIVVHKEN